MNDQDTLTTQGYLVPYLVSRLPRMYRMAFYVFNDGAPVICILHLNGNHGFFSLKSTLSSGYHQFALTQVAMNPGYQKLFS